MQHLQPNTTLQGGKYRIERLLGQGGFGNTYAGVNTVFDERTAIKEFFMLGINDRDDNTGHAQDRARDEEAPRKQRQACAPETQRDRDELKDGKEGHQTR